MALRTPVPLLQRARCKEPGKKREAAEILEQAKKLKRIIKDTPAWGTPARGRGWGPHSSKGFSEEGPGSSEPGSTGLHSSHTRQGKSSPAAAWVTMTVDALITDATAPA